MKEKGYKVSGFSEYGPKKTPTGLCPNACSMPYACLVCARGGHLYFR